MRLLWKTAEDTEWKITDIRVDEYPKDFTVKVKQAGMFCDWYTQADNDETGETWFSGGNTIRDALKDLGQEMNKSYDPDEIWDDAVDMILRRLKKARIATDVAIG